MESPQCRRSAAVGPGHVVPARPPALVHDVVPGPVVGLGPEIHRSSICLRTGRGIGSRGRDKRLGAGRTRRGWRTVHRPLRLSPKSSGGVHHHVRTMGIAERSNPGQRLGQASSHARRSSPGSLGITRAGCIDTERNRGDAAWAGDCRHGDVPAISWHVDGPRPAIRRGSRRGCHGFAPHRTALVDLSLGIESVDCAALRQAIRTLCGSTACSSPGHEPADVRPGLSRSSSALSGPGSRGVLLPNSTIEATGRVGMRAQCRRPARRGIRDDPPPLDYQRPIHREHRTHLRCLRGRRARPAAVAGRLWRAGSLHCWICPCSDCNDRYRADRLVPDHQHRRRIAAIRDRDRGSRSPCSL